MESRISAESLPAIYDSGCSGLAFDRSAFESNIFWNRVDFDKLLVSEDPTQAISEISSQRLYYSLIERGPADCLEVLNHISKEQFLSILDYDVWRRDEFVPQRVLYWTDLLIQANPQRACEQFCGLEEEYQLSTLAPFLRVYDQEAYEKMTDVDQDRLQRLPGDALFYSIECDDEATHTNIVNLLNCIMVQDMNYMLSLIAHAASMPQNESAHTAAQFRKARLEEDGFVSFEESLSCFAELDPLKVKTALNLHSTQKTDLIRAGAQSTLFLDQVLSHGTFKLWNAEDQNNIVQGLVHLANNLCIAIQVEADDLSTLKFIFTNAKALCSLGLEYLSEGDLDHAAKILLEKYPKELFRVALSLIRNHQKELVEKMCEWGVPDCERFKKNFYLQRHALMLDALDKKLFDTLGFEYCEILKGIFNRFPQYPKEIHEDGIKRISFFPISTIVELKVFEDISKRMALCFQTKLQS